jgi:16S rRNA G966 N2-methylase RsmD
MDAFRFLDLYVEEEGFDLVFADPPYLKDTRPSAGDVTNLADMLLGHPNLGKALGAEGLLILECERRQPLPSLASPIPWEILSDRSYGESRILILRQPS